MTQDDRLTALLARDQIRDVILDIATGVDRFDQALLRRVIAPDAQIDMGGENPMTGAAFANALSPPEKAPAGRTHFISNMRVRLDEGGKTAKAESYVLSIMQVERDGAPVTRQRAGRYLDSFALRDGRWQLTVRQFIDEWARVDPVTELLATGKNRAAPCPTDGRYAFWEEAV